MHAGSWVKNKFIILIKLLLKIKISFLECLHKESGVKIMVSRVRCFDGTYLSSVCLSFLISQMEIMCGLNEILINMICIAESVLGNDLTTLCI